MTVARWRLLAGGALAASLALAACSQAEPSPTASPVAHTPLAPQLSYTPPAEQAAKIGVLVGPVQGDGSEFRPLAEGARIAAYRLQLGGSPVELVVELDDGTAAGAKAAMERLVQARVSGVLVTGRGDYLADALQSAYQADTAALLLYSPQESPHAWTLAPTAGMVSSRMEAALRELKASRPFVVTAPKYLLNIDGAQRAELGDVQTVARQIKTAVDKREVDAVAIAAPARQQAELVAAIQGQLGASQLPLLLSPEATTPLFGDLIVNSGATSGRLVAIGPDAGDAVALRPSVAGESAAAFFTSLRLAAGDEACQNLYRDDSCAQTSLWADATSHDGVVVLARAVEKAGSSDPQAVKTALGTLKLGPTDGLVGPELDLRRGNALADGQLTSLYASTSDPGMRPLTVDGEPPLALFWFAD